MARSFFIAALVAIGLAGTVSAQSYQEYQNRRADLRALSEIFGELHHLRRLCAARTEANIWRERMKDLMQLEEPPAEDKQAMARNFNDGYRSAQARHSACDRRTRDYAAARAADGERIIARLSAPLEAQAAQAESLEFAPTAPIARP